MGNDILEIRAHVSGLLGASRAMLGTVIAQLGSPYVEKFPEVRWLLERLIQTLNAHVDELGEHLRRLGGTADVVPQNAPEPAQSVSPWLRDYYGALSSQHTRALMLETHARAHGYSSTAALARRHREEIATVQARMRDLLPTATKEEIGHMEIAT